jgi:hypothetical protein
MNIQSQPDIINMNDINNGTINIEMIYCNYYLNIPFKLISQMPITFNYAIKYVSNVNTIITYMREVIKKDFKISFDFDIIIDTEGENGLDIYDYLKILYVNTSLENITIYDLINKSTGFYIRPHNTNNYLNSSSPTTTSNDENNNCPVCFTSLGHIRRRFFCCTHHICNSCFDSWNSRNGANTSCPLCRAAQII